MGLWPWTKRKKVEAVGQLMLVRARFDAAQTTPDNHKHWSNADYVSADAAASPEVRRTLRNRALYEVANNSYARGIVLTLANDVIGTCPRLQILADSAEANGTIDPESVAPGEATRTGYPFSPLPLPHGQEQGFLRLQ
jgi:capsid protein